MSLNVKGEKCAVCNAYLFDEDEIVYCPQCGAPHHKDCYLRLGHCALEEFHGTENQYKRPEPQKESTQNENTSPKLKVCGMCGEMLDGDETHCENCGAPNIEKMGGRFINFDFLGGVPADLDLGDGVTADEAKMFVGSNTQRYIPKFANFKIGKKSSWNWAAFLAPAAWLMSRKMYALGAIFGALQVALVMFAFPFNSAISYLDFTNAKTYAQMGQIIAENISTIGISVLVLAFVGTTLDLILRVVLGTFGDLIYKNRVISEVAQIKQNSEDIKADYRRKGGFSLWAAVIGLMVVEYLPSIIATFF